MLVNAWLKHVNIETQKIIDFHLENIDNQLKNHFDKIEPLKYKFDEDEHKVTTHIIQYVIDKCEKAGWNVEVNYHNKQIILKIPKEILKEAK